MPREGKGPDWGGRGRGWTVWNRVEKKLREVEWSNSNSFRGPKWVYYRRTLFVIPRKKLKTLNGAGGIPVAPPLAGGHFITKAFNGASIVVVVKKSKPRDSGGSPDRRSRPNRRNISAKMRKTKT